MSMPPGFSEYEGGGTMPNTVFPKGHEALTPSDKLRLQSLTGQEDDSQAPVDSFFWHGNTAPDLSAERTASVAREAEAQARLREERIRYRESKP